jgi:hypothetical protein
LSIYFATLEDGGVPPEAIEGLRQRLQAIPGMVFKTKKAPNVALTAALTKPEVLEQVQAAFFALMQAVSASTSE